LALRITSLGEVRKIGRRREGGEEREREREGGEGRGGRERKEKKHSRAISLGFSGCSTRAREEKEDVEPSRVIVRGWSTCDLERDRAHPPHLEGSQSPARDHVGRGGGFRNPRLSRLVGSSDEKGTELLDEEEKTRIALLRSVEQQIIKHKWIFCRRVLINDKYLHGNARERERPSSLFKPAYVVYTSNSPILRSLLLSFRFLFLYIVLPLKQNAVMNASDYN